MQELKLVSHGMRLVTRRVEVLDAIRAGHTTTPAIARYLKADLSEVIGQVRCLRRLGRVTDTGVRENNTGKSGRPAVRYKVDEDWTRRSAAKTESTREKITAAVRACWNDPGFRARQKAGRVESSAKKALEVSSAVPKRYRAVFREITYVLGREVAELYATEALKMSEAVIEKAAE